MVNTNENAVFVLGDKTMIPVVAGSLVKFSGNVVHNRVINSGHVRCAGRFHLNTFSMVGMPLDIGQPNGHNVSMSLRQCLFDRIENGSFDQ
jgi:hypothetical protein